MRRAAQPQIFAAQPVIQIVAGFIAALRKIRNFIAMKAALCQHPHRHALHFIRRIIIRHDRRAAPHALRHPRAVLHDQAVGGNVANRQRARRVQRIAPDLHGLPRQGVHQIQTDIIKAARARQTHRVRRLRGIMDPADGGKQSRIEALHADGQAVYARFAVGMQLARIDRAGIGFQRNFRIIIKFRVCAQFAQYLRDIARVHQGRRAAAEENAAHPMGAQRICPAAHFIGQGAKIRFNPILPPRVGRKIAIIAFANAERHMDINAQWFHLRIPPRLLLRRLRACSARYRT